ncbi:hypothetical protein F5Y03DRAFT_402926 [Xylaria venustula]|nr:hypothetical protein F5Y03DRAFT_402926 [Xylaria venustula]
MAETKITPAGNIPGACFWLRWAQIVNLGHDASFTPFKGTDEELREYLADFEGIDKEIHVLDLIQQSRSTFFNPATLQILLNSLVDDLPADIQDRVALHLGADYSDPDTGPVIGQPVWFSQDDAQFQRTLNALRTGALPALDSGNKQFIFWVVDAGTPQIPYYVTIVLHYKPSSLATLDIFDQITDWAVIDARGVGRNPEGYERTVNRVSELLKDRMRRPKRHDVWLPPYQGEKEDFASGLVAYSVVSQLLDRVGTIHWTGEFDMGALFAPLRPWFNPDSVRAEALGRAAMKALERLNWKARLGVFPIQPPGEGQPGLKYGQDLAPSKKLPEAHRFIRTIQDKTRPMMEALFDDLASMNRTTQMEGRARRFAMMKQGTQTEASSSSSSSSSSAESEAGGTDKVEEDAPGNFHDPVVLYYERKREDLRMFRKEIEKTRMICYEAEEFAERVECEVLDAPGDNVPTAYAEHRLFWLTKRAIESSLDLDRLSLSLHRNYVGEHIHRTVEERLGLPGVREEFLVLLAQFKETYTAAHRVLVRTYRARFTYPHPRDQLGEARREEGSDGGYVGRNKSVSRKRPLGPRSRTPEKRRYTKEPTFELDQDGQRVYTLGIMPVGTFPKRRKTQE